MWAVRRNLPGIVIYLTALIIQWRLHEYGHLFTARLAGCSILMGLDSWMFYSCNSPLVVLSGGAFVNILVGLFGLYLLILYRGGIRGVFGFYLLFSGFMMNFLASIVGIPALIGSDPFKTETIYRIMYTPILLAMLAYGVVKSELKLRPSCIGWLTLITIITGSVIVLLDKLIWQGYRTGVPLFKPVAGQMTVVYMLDAILAAFLLTLNVRILKGFQGE